MRTKNYQKLIQGSRAELDHEKYIGRRDTRRYLLLEALISSRDFLDILTEFNPVFQTRLDRIQNQINKLTETYPKCL